MSQRVIDRTAVCRTVPGVTLMLALIAGVAAAAAAPLTLRFARGRSLAQPLLSHPAEERRIIATIAEHPGWYVYVHQLAEEHFVDLALGQAWQALKDANAGLVLPETPSDEKEAYRILEKLEHLVVAVTMPSVGHDVEPLSSREELLDAATKVYSAGMDRTEFAGSSRVERTGDLRRPLVRHLAPVSTARRAVTAATSLVGVVASVLAGAKGGNAVTAVALAVLTFGSVVWLLVDLDTMYIDVASFWAVGGTAWALTLAAAGGDGRLGDALVGLFVSGAVVAFIELVNQFYKRVRHQHGMGTGDYLLILATIGVPVAVTGSWMLGQWILVLSLALGVAGWMVKRVTVAGFGRDTPYAFGPYLATGWMAGVLIWSLL
jgi:hypothetical protein